MPICEADPWRMQYFETQACPPNLRIPTEDPDAYEWNPTHHWVYNKLLIAESQGLTCGPHGLTPRNFPVFSKPIINLRGMGAGSRVLATLADYEHHQTSGHFWMNLLEGEHVSSDVAIQHGNAVWFRHSRGEPLHEGTFDYWIVEPPGRAELQHYCVEWIARHLPDYTGMLNIESIGGRIIEVHLRLSDQYPDLYGNGWLDALIGLYANGAWHFEDLERRAGYSVVLFGRHGMRYQHPPASLVEDIKRTPGVTSVQITFHENRAPEWHSMPPGGFRLAIVNGWDLEAGRAARDRLAVAFAETATAVDRRGRGRRVSSGETRW